MEDEYVSIDEKKKMASNFIKNLYYNRYNIELSLLAENALAYPNQNNIDSLNIQLQEIDSKILALKNELEELEGA